MKTPFTVQLLDGNIHAHGIDIGQAMDIALIPQEMNEKRISALIGHLSDDNELAARLTAQERYYFLLNHLMITQSRYVDAGVDIESYLLKTIQNQVPKSFEIADARVNHLLGRHVCVLESKCEHVYDWICGQMACQLSGDLSTFIGGDRADFIWPDLDPAITDEELSEVIDIRAGLISKLDDDEFNSLTDGFYEGVDHLAHFVVIGCENSGLNLVEQGGEGAGTPSRFLALGYLQGTAAKLAECLA